MGFACAALGDLRRAAREFQMGGTEAEAKNNLGFAYERRGDMANAYDLYVEAVRLGPEGGASAFQSRPRCSRPRPARSARGGAPGPGRDRASIPPIGEPPTRRNGNRCDHRDRSKAVPADAPKKEAHP